MTSKHTAVLIVPDMSCSHCVSRVDRALRSLDGVEGVSVDLDSKRVTVQFDPSVTSLEKIEAKLEAIGYPSAGTGVTDGSPRT